MSLISRDLNLDYDKAYQEAAVIVSATVLGFCATRALLAQPFSLDLSDEPGPPSDDAAAAERVQERMLILDIMGDVLEGLHALVAPMPNAARLRPADIRRAVGDAVAPSRGDPLDPEVADTITGRPGGEALSGAARWRRPWLDPVEGVQAEYSGRGAYIGFLDDPLWYVGEEATADTPRPPRRPTRMEMVAPTGAAEVNAAERSRRYLPNQFAQWLQAKGMSLGAHDYGLIHDSNHQPPPTGFGVAPQNASALLGYVHGMAQALVDREERGPWCVAHEQAIGAETTKLASCFACTTYMYAAGAPPSSCHIDSGESWSPPRPTQPADRAASGTALGTTWHVQCEQHLRLGLILLHAYFEADGPRHPNNPYPAIVTRVATELDNRMSVAGAKTARGGNLFLDALAIHEKDSVRLRRVLGLDGATSPEGLLKIAAVQAAHAEDPTSKAAIDARRGLRSYPPTWRRVPRVGLSCRAGANGTLVVSVLYGATGVRTRDGRSVVVVPQLPCQLVLTAPQGAPVITQVPLRSQEGDATSVPLYGKKVGLTFTPQGGNAAAYTLSLDTGQADKGASSVTLTADA